MVLLCIVMAARDRGPWSSLILPQSIDQRGHWKRRERDGMRGAIGREGRKRAVASAAAPLLFPELIFQGLPPSSLLVTPRPARSLPRRRAKTGGASPVLNTYGQGKGEMPILRCLINKREGSRKERGQKEERKKGPWRCSIREETNVAAFVSPF